MVDKIKFESRKSVSKFSSKSVTTSQQDLSVKSYKNSQQSFDKFENSNLVEDYAKQYYSNLVSEVRIGSSRSLGNITDSLQLITCETPAGSENMITGMIAKYLNKMTKKLTKESSKTIDKLSVNLSKRILPKISELQSEAETERFIQSYYNNIVLNLKAESLKFIENSIRNSKSQSLLETNDLKFKDEIEEFVNDYYVKMVEHIKVESIRVMSKHNINVSEKKIEPGYQISLGFMEYFNDLDIKNSCLENNITSKVSGSGGDRPFKLIMADSFRNFIKPYYEGLVEKMSSDISKNPLKYSKCTLNESTHSDATNKNLIKEHYENLVRNAIDHVADEKSVDQLTEKHSKETVAEIKSLQTKNTQNFVDFYYDHICDDVLEQWSQKIKDFKKKNSETIIKSIENLPQNEISQKMIDKVKTLSNKDVQMVPSIKLSNKKSAIVNKSQNNTNQFVNDYYIEMLQEFDSQRNIDTDKNLTKSLNQKTISKLKDDSNKVAKSVEMSKLDSNIKTILEIDSNVDLQKDHNTKNVVAIEKSDIQKSEQHLPIDKKTEIASNPDIKSQESNKFVAKDFSKKYYDDIVNMTLDGSKFDIENFAQNYYDDLIEA